MLASESDQYFWLQAREQFNNDQKDKNGPIVGCNRLKRHEWPLSVGEVQCVALSDYTGKIAFGTTSGLRCCDLERLRDDPRPKCEEFEIKAGVSDLIWGPGDQLVLLGHDKAVHLLEQGRLRNIALDGGRANAGHISLHSIRTSEAIDVYVRLCLQ